MIMKSAFTPLILSLALAASAPSQTTAPAASGLLPPPGVAPATPVNKLPTEDKANDEAFAKAAAVGTHAEVAVIDGPTVNLEEALRITLIQQPKIKLAQEDMEIARGALQDFIAVFDTHLQANVKHGQKVTPQTNDDIAKQVLLKRGLEKQLAAIRAAEKSGGGQTAVTGSPSDAANASNPSAAKKDPTVVAQQQQNALADLVLAQALALNSALNTADTNSLAKDAQKAKSDSQRGNALLLKSFERETAKELSEFRTTSSTRATTTTYDLGLKKTFRNGITVNPGIDFTKESKDNFVNLKVDVTVPLGAGRGGVALRAAEDAGYIDLIGSEMQLRHEISAALFRTASAYWNLIGAQQTYQVIKQSALVNETFVSLTSKRKELGEASDAEVIKADARRATLELQTLQALFAIMQARRDLATAMGLEGRNLVNPPYALGNIPTDVNIGSLRMDNLGMIGLKAITYRDDRRAALQTLRSGKLLTEASFFEIKPAADLVFSAGLGAVDTGSHGSNYFSAFGDNKMGASTSIGLRLDWPFALNEAKGAYLKQLGSYRKDQINLFDRDRDVQNKAMLAAAEVLSTKARMAAADRASELAFRSLTAERTRYNVGEGSLLDTLLIEEQLSNARQQSVLAKVGFANALANLRFQTGTILTPESGHTPTNVSFKTAAFKSVPNFESIPFPDQAPGLDTLSYGVKPAPLLTKLFGSNPELRDHNRAIKPTTYYQSMEDLKKAGGPVLDTSGSHPVVYSAGPSSQPAKVASKTAPSPQSVSATPAAPVVAPTPQSSAPNAPQAPKGLLDRIFR